MTKNPNTLTAKPSDGPISFKKKETMFHLESDPFENVPRQSCCLYYPKLAIDENNICLSHSRNGLLVLYTAPLLALYIVC